MVNELEIYNLTKEWIAETMRGNIENFEDYRHKFGKLERDTFGGITERCQNPLAMKYDHIRNELVNYFGYKINECLGSAIETFSEIMETRENNKKLSE